jgi:hypothetical protein
MNIMKVLKNSPVTVGILLLSIVILGIYAFLRIPSTEGFNPSDDGVILAQSYRILNGEVPHRDFISIRPVGSAIMHAIHFYSPLPLELSARWLVLAEYLFYSILISVLLTGSWFRGLRKPYYLLLVSGSVVVMFILNQNHYNLFPWTTIDSLFWFSLALFAWYKLKINYQTAHHRWQILIFFALSCSLLCRQTFALPAGLLLIRIVIWEFHRTDRNWVYSLRAMIPALIVGMIPGWIYIFFLSSTGAWSDFFQQMTGRTEVWQTGVVKFWHSFWNSPLLLLYGLAAVTGLVKRWNSEMGRDNFAIDLIILVQKWVSVWVKIVLGFMVFLKPELLFQISLIFFWIIILDIVLIYLHNGSLPRWIRPVFWILIVAWTSALSLGDNAPVFSLGLLAGTGILMQIKDFWTRFYRTTRTYQLVAGGVLIPALFVLSLIVQPRINYRDLPAEKLICNGGDVFPGLKGLELSPLMADYLLEIKTLYQEFGSPSGKFVVWPNNALIYPLLGSSNPFILDWMQSAEFAGNQKKLLESTRKILNTQDLYLLVEKTNVKWIAAEQIPVDHFSSDYPYLQLLDSLATKTSIESKWFDVYHTK